MLLSSYHILGLLGLAAYSCVWQIYAFRSSSSYGSSSTNSNNSPEGRMHTRARSASLALLLDNGTFPKRFGPNGLSMVVDEDELLEIQAYLEKYGYIDISKTEEGAQMLDQGQQTAGGNQNGDHHHEIAVELLQKTLAMRVNGRIGKSLMEATKNEIRCGNPDFKLASLAPVSSNNQGHHSSRQSRSASTKMPPPFLSRGSCGLVHQDPEQYSSADFEWPKNVARRKSDNARRQQQRGQQSRQMNYRIASYSKRLARHELDRLVGRAFDRWAIESQSNLHFVQVDERGYADDLGSSSHQDHTQEIQIELFFDDRRLHKLELFDGKVCRFAPIELAHTVTLNGLSEIHINDQLFNSEQVHPSPDKSDCDKDRDRQPLSTTGKMGADSVSWESSSNNNHNKKLQQNLDDSNRSVGAKSSKPPRTDPDFQYSDSDMVANEWGESNVNLRRRSPLADESSGVQYPEQDEYKGRSGFKSNGRDAIIENLDEVIDTSIDSEIQQANGKLLRFKRWLMSTTVGPKLQLGPTSTSLPVTRNTQPVATNFTSGMGSLLSNAALLTTMASASSGTTNSSLTPPTTPIGQVIAQYGPQVVAHVTQNPQIIQKLLPLLQKLQQNPQLLQQVLQTLQVMNIDTGDIIRQVTNLAHSGAIDLPKLIQAVTVAASEQHNNSNNNNNNSTGSLLSELPALFGGASQHPTIKSPSANPLNDTGAYDVATRFIQAQLHQGHSGQGPLRHTTAAPMVVHRQQNVVGVNNIDLESVIAHQIGHALGIGHNLRRASSIMHPYFSGGAKNNTNDDIEAVTALYGRADEFQPIGNSDRGDLRPPTGYSQGLEQDRGYNPGRDRERYSGSGSSHGGSSNRNGRIEYDNSNSNSNNNNNNADIHGWPNSRQSSGGGGGQWRDIMKSMPEPLTMGKTLTPFQQMQQQQPNTSFRGKKSTL